MEVPQRAWVLRTEHPSHSRPLPRRVPLAQPRYHGHRLHLHRRSQLPSEAQGTASPLKRGALLTHHAPRGRLARERQRRVSLLQLQLPERRQQSHRQSRPRFFGAESTMKQARSLHYRSLEGAMQQLRLQQRQLQEQHSWREEQEGLGTGLGQTAARCRRHQLEGGVSAEQKPGYS